MLLLQESVVASGLSLRPSAGQVVPVPTFHEFQQLDSSLVVRLEESGIMKPTDIQSVAIPQVLETLDKQVGNRVALVQAETGSGKTLCYLLPFLTKIQQHIKQLQGRRQRRGSVQRQLLAIVVVPNRELAVQVVSEIVRLVDLEPTPAPKQAQWWGKATCETEDQQHGERASVPFSDRDMLEYFPQLASAALSPPPTRPKPVSHVSEEGEIKSRIPQSQFVQLIVGGRDDADTQMQRLRNENPWIVVGTAERTLDVIERVPCVPSYLASVKYLAVDEADRVIRPLGRYADWRRRINRLRHPNVGEDLISRVYHANPAVSLVCVSATLNVMLKSTVKRLGWSITRPGLISAGVRFQIPVGIDHFSTVCEEGAKVKLFVSAFRQLQLRSALVFVPTWTPIEKVVERLRAVGLRTVSLHSMVNDDPGKRRAFTESFESGAIQVTVATEDSCRGIHFDHLSHVFILYGIPEAATYLHLAGRTGRLGRSGTVVNIVSFDEAVQVDKYHRFLGVQVKPLASVIDIQ